jgi:pimeloyl-ACP methyl ester carboxylesterase
MSLSNNGGANTGEVLRAAARIVPGDFESWYSEFKFLADAIHEKAIAINKTRFPVSAREAYFRSSSYYRAADFFLHGNQSDPRINLTWTSALADFDTATSLLPIPPRRYNLTAKNFSVPIIYFPAQASAKSENGKSNRSTKRCATKKLPTVIVGSGYDGSQEALYHHIGRGVLERGWNFVSYEGPGQPSVIRQQGRGFIPEWWDVVTPVVDYLHTRDDVDTDRIALLGMSFGGTLAPLAASREHRLSAVLSVDGLISMQKAIIDQLASSGSLGQGLVQMFKSGNVTGFDELMLGIMKSPSAPTQLRWLVGQGLWSFATESPFQWFTKLGEISSDAPVLANITCPVFVAEGQDDSSARGQAQEMVAALGNRSTYNLFKTELGAGEHCQLGADAQLAQVAWDWLSDIWASINIPSNLTSSTY